MNPAPPGGRGSGDRPASRAPLARRDFIRLGGKVAASFLLFAGGDRFGRSAGLERIAAPKLVVVDGWVLRASDLDRPL